MQSQAREAVFPVSKDRRIAVWSMKMGQGYGDYVRTLRVSCSTSLPAPPAHRGIAVIVTNDLCDKLSIGEI
jgi:hypothetical protein